MCNLVCNDCPFDIERTIPEMHEIHITVSGNKDEFLRVCKENSIKPLNMEIPTIAGKEFQMMTSQIVKGSREETLKETDRIYSILSQNDFNVERVKIESSINPTIDDKGYFEGHLVFDVLKDLEKEFDSISSRVSVSLGAEGYLHKSRNAFKVEGEVSTWILTNRAYNVKSRKEYEDRIDLIKIRMDEMGFKSKKTIIEYVWMDTNYKLDKNWKTV